MLHWNIVHMMRYLQRVKKCWPQTNFWCNFASRLPYPFLLSADYSFLCRSQCSLFWSWHLCKTHLRLNILDLMIRLWMNYSYTYFISLYQKYRQLILFLPTQSLYISIFARKKNLYLTISEATTSKLNQIISQPDAEELRKIQRMIEITTKHFLKFCIFKCQVLCVAKQL